MANFEWLEDKENGFSEDRLNRARVAEFLTDYLTTEGTKRNYVLNVNAEWGAGKTYFLKRWQHSIKNDHPVVYIDAWQQDFSDDPLLTVVSSIIDQLQNQHGSQGDATIQKAARGVLGLFKVAAPFVAKAVVKKVSGIDTDEFADKLKAEGAFDMAASDVAGKFVEGLLEDHANKKKSIDHFKASIKEWASNIKGTTNLHPPVFIFIDELDRCRPTYAIEMLEVIKHLFDMEGVVFVVATDTQQLQHAIKVIYGEGFDASTYLGRFFNRRITLRCGEIRDYVQNLPQFESLKELVVEKKGVWPGQMEQRDLLEQTCAPMENYELDLRTAERIVDQLLAILEHINNRSFQIDILFMMTLLCANAKDQGLYDALSSKRATSHSFKGNGSYRQLNSNLINDEKVPFIKRRTITIRFFHGDIAPNSEPFISDYEFISLVQNRLKQLEAPQSFRQDISMNINSRNSEDREKRLLYSYIDLAPNRILPKWQDYFNWVELASSFDE